MNQELIEKVVKEVFQVLAQRSSGQSLKEEKNTGSVNTLSGSVITEELLKKELNGAKEVVFQSKAILTPSARDYLRQNQIQWGMGAITGSAGTTEKISSWKITCKKPWKAIY